MTNPSESNPNSNRSSESSRSEFETDSEVNFEQAEAFILSKLKKELPDYLHYHSAKHTLDVKNAAERIARNEGVEGEELILLKTAALYHDSGFLEKPGNHEKRGCVFSCRVLPDFGYSEEQIEIICQMIMATQLPQKPNTLLEKILCDADLDYLGRDDFWEISDLLRKEFLNLEKVENNREWNELQVKFFESHNYFTETARRKRREKKQQHLDEIRKKVQADK